jgi:hypothetical protein
LSKYSLIKTIEAQKLNMRTGVPTTDPPVTVPFGAIIEDVQPDRDMRRFTFHGELYRCPEDVLAAALDTRPAAPPETHAAPAAAPAPAPAQAAPDAPAAPCLLWHEVASNHGLVLRAKVPGGWLVTFSGTLAFYPDPAHAWNGASLP